MVSLCRDEITNDLLEELDSLWGQSFNIGSLGGMVFCGSTTFTNAMSHVPAPIDGGREKFLFTVAPHIGIDEDGNIGVVERAGRGSSVASEALSTFLNELRAEKPLFLLTP